jgi:hypothetical protein
MTGAAQYVASNDMWVTCHLPTVRDDYILSCDARRDVDADTDVPTTMSFAFDIYNIIHDSTLTVVVIKRDD